MHIATQRIYSALKDVEGLKVFTNDTESGSDAWVQFGLQNGGSYRIRFISKDEDNDVAVRVFSLIKINDDQRTTIINLLNDLNCEYRYAKFCCDKDGDINVEYDYPVRGKSPEDSAEEIILRFVKIIKDAYPRLMRALWQ